MIKARRDPEICALVSVPLNAWKDHIVSLLSLEANESDKSARSKAEEIAAACMAQLLGRGLLLGSPHDDDCRFDVIRDRVASRAIVALTNLVKGAQ